MSTQTFSFVIDATVELMPSALPSNCHVIARDAVFGRKKLKLKQTYTAASLVAENSDPQPIEIAQPSEAYLDVALADAYDAGDYLVLFSPYRRDSAASKALHRRRREQRLPRCLIVENVAPGVRYAALIELLMRILTYADMTIFALEKLLPIVYKQVAAYWLLHMPTATNKRNVRELANRWQQRNQHRLVLPNELASPYQTQVGPKEKLVDALALKLVDAHSAEDRTLALRQQGFESETGSLREKVNRLSGSDVAMQRNRLAWSPALASRLNQRYLEAVVTPSSAEIEQMYHRAAQIAKHHDTRRPATTRLSDYRVQL